MVKADGQHSQSWPGCQYLSGTKMLVQLPKYLSVVVLSLYLCVAASFHNELKKDETTLYLET